MRRALAVVIAVTASVATAQPEQEIDQVRQAYNRAYTAGDAAAIAGLLTPDAVFLPPGEAPISGRDALRARYEAQFKQWRSTFEVKPGELVVDGNLAFMRGPFERTDTSIRGGDVRHFTGDYLMIFTRQPEGWRIARDVWTVRSAPVTGPTVALSVPVNEFKSLVEAHLTATADLLRLVASSPEAQSASWEAIAPRLKALAQMRPEANAVWFANPDGTLWTAQKGATQESLRDREYFPSLISGKPVMGALVVSHTTGRRSIIVAEPIRKDGKVVGAVGMSLAVEPLSKSLEAQLGLPQNMVFYAIDSTGQLSVHRDPKLIFEYPSAIGGPDLKDAMQQMLTRDSGLVRYDFRGIEKTVQFQRSKSLGWVFAIGMNDPAERGVGGAGDAE